MIKAANPDLVKVDGKISTNIEVISAPRYFWYKYKILIYVIAALLLLAAGFILTALWTYGSEVENYSIDKSIEVSVPSVGLRGGETVSLSTGKNTAYLNVSNYAINLSDEETDYSIGHFILKVPEGNKILLGLKYFWRKDEIFQVSYVGRIDPNSQVGEVPYRENMEIVDKTKSGNTEITV